MTPRAGIRVTKDAITDKLNQMVARSHDARAYLNRIFLPLFYQAQIDRWRTENSSEGASWKPLSSRYAKEKVKRFGSYPGGGKALMVATGHLLNVATGRESGLNKIVTEKSLILSFDPGATPYARFAAKERPFMRFSKSRVSEWKRGLRDFILKGEDSSWLRTG